MTGLGIDRKVASAVALAMFAGSSAAANPLVDRQASSPVTSLTREDLENLPTGRRIEDLVKTCPSTTFPTVTRDPQILVDGQPTAAPFSINCLAPTDLELIEVYRTHNAARAEYGAPPLARDPLLELSAGDYVGQLARTGKMVHAPRAGRGNIRENISQGLPGWSAGQLVGSWLKEKKNFVPGTFPNVSRTGNWYDIGHWAQMIWLRTVVIGCARAAGIGATWMVCRYGPGGNRDGELVGVPVEGKAMAGASSTYVRPRLIGGDYGTGKAGKGDDRIQPCDGPPVGADGAIPVNSAVCGEEDTKVEAPTLPTTEVFNPSSAKVADVDLPPDPEIIEPETVADEGEDEVVEDMAPTDLAKSGPLDPCSVPITKSKSMIPEELYVLTLQAESAAKNGDLDALRRYEQLAREIAEGVKTGEISGLHPDAAKQAVDQIGAIMDAAVGPEGTSIQQPDLPTQEVFNPANLPQCPMDVM